MSSEGPGDVDHYVWQAYYLPDRWGDEMGELLTTSKGSAMRRIARAANVPNAGWEENENADYPLFQLRRTTHHVVTVRRVPVYE